MKFVAALGIVLAALALVPFGAVMAEDEETSLIGEPVDMNCFLAGKSGEDHATCAKSCAERGNPIGLSVIEGDKTQLYLVLGADGKAAKDLMAEYMGAEVEVMGKVVAKDGMKVIIVSEVFGDDDEWFLEEEGGGGSVKNK